MIRSASVCEHPDDRWEHLQRRDKSADGTFVYAVITTGVYCRPACPSRLPRFENVRFFARNEDAAKAGFRPCKRCKPEDASLETRQAAVISKACALIDAADEMPDFEAIAQAVGMSRHHFHRVFKQIAGLTPGAYFRSLRERRAVDELGKGSSVTEAIYAAGYSSSSRFYGTLAPKLGLKPGAFKKGGAGETIKFAVGECSLGSVVVASTEKGLCAIEFGDSPEQLVRGLQDRYPNAEFAGGDRNFEQIVAEVVGFADDPRRGLKLPLHVRGTAFQHKIWQILSEIPRGQTMSYAEVAARAGNPSAVRAVANACAENKLAVAIPCHRVVRTDGSLSGYRWGVERKAALLAREAAE